MIALLRLLIVGITLYARPFALFLGVVAAFYALFKSIPTVSAFADTAHTKLISLLVTDTSVGWGQYYSMANTFFPLNETMAMAGILFQWALACYAVRIIKSLIPTIA